MDSILTLAYIDEILEDPTVELIEVWDRVLYVRKKKGCGRNTFKSKAGLEYKLNAYYTTKEFRTISKRYHPDKQNWNDKYKQQNANELFASISVSREQLQIYELYSGADDAKSYIRSLPEFAKLASSKKPNERDSLIKAITKHLDSTRLTKSLSEDERRKYGVWANFISDNSKDIGIEILQDFAEAWVNSIEESKRERWGWYNKRCNDKLTFEQWCKREDEEIGF